ncbi:hypothetical protein D9M69_603240 [compost metagenome]
MRRIDPAGPEHQGAAAGVPDRLLARELGGAVDVAGVGGVGFRVGLPRCAVEDIVGRIMDEQGIRGSGMAGEGGDRQSVYLGRLRLLGFGQVHRGVGRGVDDRIGPAGRQGGAQAFLVAQIGRVAARRHQLPQRGQCAAQLAAHLAVLAQQ